MEEAHADTAVAARSRASPAEGLTKAPSPEARHNARAGEAIHSRGARCALLSRRSTLQGIRGGAGDGDRTRDMQLGRLPLCQLSYSRSLCNRTGTSRAGAPGYPAPSMWESARPAAARTLALRSLRMAVMAGIAEVSRCFLATRSAISRTRQASSSRAVTIAGVAVSSHAHRRPRAPHTRSQYSGPAGSSKPAAQRAGRPPSARVSSGLARLPARRARQPATTAGFPSRSTAAATLSRGVVPHLGLDATRIEATRCRSSRARGRRPQPPAPRRAARSTCRGRPAPPSAARVPRP